MTIPQVLQKGGKKFLSVFYVSIIDVGVYLCIVYMSVMLLALPKWSWRLLFDITHTKKRS